MKGLIVSEDKTIKSIANYYGEDRKKYERLFRESSIDQEAILDETIKFTNQHTELHSTQESIAIIDFTTTEKTGKKQEWIEWVFNEEAKKSIKRGHVNCLSIELNDYALKVHRFESGINSFR